MAMLTEAVCGSVIRIKWMQLSEPVAPQQCPWREVSAVTKLPPTLLPVTLTVNVGTVPSQLGICALACCTLKTASTVTHIIDSAMPLRAKDLFFILRYLARKRNGLRVNLFILLYCRYKIKTEER